MRHDPHRIRVLLADVDVTASRAYCVCGNRSGLNEAKRIVLQQEPVRERARVTFVGIHDHILGFGACAGNGLPFGACGKCGAASPSQSGRLHHVQQRLWRHPSSFLKRCPAAAIGRQIAHATAQHVA